MSARSVSRYQRRILAGGVGLACLLFVVGAPIYLDAVESDLTERVTADLEAAGIDGVTVSFSGQTGSIRCEAPLGDPRAALDVAYAVRGVRSMEDLPDECRVLTVASDDGDDGDDDGLVDVTSTVVDEATTTTAAATPDFESVLDVLGGNPQFSLLDQLVHDSGLATELAEGGPSTLFAPVDAAFDALPADAVAQLRSDPELLDRVLRNHLVDGRLLAEQLTPGPLTTTAGEEVTVDTGGGSLRVDGATVVEPDVLADNGVVHAIDGLLLPAGVDLSARDELVTVSAAFVDGRYVLQGVVRSEVERTILVLAASGAVGLANTVDELTVDPDRGLGEATAQELALLVDAMPDHLVSGTAAFDGETLTVDGAYVDDAQRSAIEEIAATVGAEVSLTPTTTSSDADAATLEAELNAFVAENPIRFQPTSSVLDGSAAPILDELARRARQFPGLVIVVEGHTDSDGDPQTNLDLSQQRAVAVRQALVERGLDPAALQAEGFGSAQPILVDGVEDKAASRRVEFRAEVA